MNPLQTNKECPLCGGDINSEKSVQVQEKGIKNVLKFSTQRGTPGAELRQKLKGVDSVLMHESCRKNYTRRMDPSENVFVSPSKPILRSGIHNFNFKTGCVLCGREVPLCSPGGPPRTDRGVCLVNKETLRKTILDACDARVDQWARTAAIRVRTVSSLVAAGACYHKSCLAAVLDSSRAPPPVSPTNPVLTPSPTTPSPNTVAKFPKRPATSPVAGTPSRIPVPRLALGRGRGRGRPLEEAKLAAFTEMCNMLEDEDECQFVLTDLLARIPGCATYSERHLWRLLKERYNESISIVERPGKSSIVCFLGEQFDRLGASWYEQKSKLDPQEQRKEIVRKAAEIVRADILAKAYDLESFSQVADIATGGTSLVPESLRDFLQTVTMKRKRGHGITDTARICESTAHNLIAATRPRSFLSPLHLGLGVWVHRKIGSKMLCDILHRLGVSSSYSLVQEFEKAVVLHAKFDIDRLAYIQFAFDNFDSNVATVDGHRTVHTMGGMMYVTPETGVPPQSCPPRLKPTERGASLSGHGYIPLQIYKRPPKAGFGGLVVRDLRPGTASEVSRCADEARKLNLLWLVGHITFHNFIPGWNGFMCTVMEGTRAYMLSATLPLPFVNLTPSDPETIYTCLIFSAEQCKKQGQAYCVVTFDQPLYWKAVEIVLSSPQGSILRLIVLRLGGFHLIISFMGSIGYLMSGSGIEDLWVTVYARNSIPQMLSGKAYSRAVRAHFLTQTALLLLVVKKLLEDNAQLKKEVLSLCAKLYKGEEKVNAALENPSVSSLLTLLDASLHRLQEESGTGKLWVQYIEDVETLRHLIRAERLGDWPLHLFSTNETLPTFHAAFHLHYAKSAHLYLQQMLDLEAVLPPSELSQLCDKGFFTVRQSDRVWSGNFSDQTIEMKLMRSMKTMGGITMPGRGITESTIAVWVKTQPHCSQVIEALETFCGESGGTSEQHVELRDSRKKRDSIDLDLFSGWLQQHNPFEKTGEQPISLSSGLVADSTVTCHKAREIGSRSMQNMAGKNFFELSLQRKDRAVPMSAMTRSVIVRGNVVQVNPTQLFHRILVATKDIAQLEQYFEYELAPFPTSLFDENGMRKTEKSKIIPALESLYIPADEAIPENVQYVIDGGFLLHKVVWPRQTTYKEVLDMYVKFVVTHYGASSIVVFDGYPDGPSTKDPEHNLRAASGSSPDLEFTQDMTISTNQPKFLSNPKNKQRLIEMMSESLRQAGVTVEQATADADKLIVDRAIASAQTGTDSVVVGTDTDLLVILIGTAPHDLPLHFLVPPSGKTGRKVHHIAELQQKMGNTARHVLLAHAFTGVDTTSAIFRGSKKKALQKIGSPTLEADAEAFLTPNQDQDTVAAAGERIMLALYGCQSIETLGQARWHLYKRTVARQSVGAKFELASLPPTTAGARQHSLRVYIQVQAWLGNELQPTEWGWQLLNGQYHPITTTMAPAPPSLLELISCNCRPGGCVQGCTCRLASLPCSSICGQCAGVSCTNTEPVNHESEDSDDPDNPDPIPE